VSSVQEPSLLVGESPAMRRALALVERFAPTSSAVLLVGATGTGKDLLARHIHALSGRGGRFVPVNCGALPREMAESLLFGHRRGAFSGAVESRRGYVELARDGTLFLDELLCLAPEGQAKLLRALDSGEIQPLGEEHAHIVDVRVVAAVQERLPVALTSGVVRADLFHRLAGVVILLPPLVDRTEDIVPLARHFAALQGQALDLAAERLLLSYQWPGNVRELRYVIERAGRLVANGTLPSAAVAEAIHLGAPEAPLDRSESTSEHAQLVSVCQANDGHATRVARALGIHRATLFRRLKRAGISLRRLR
jgi:transcriptional regulator with PAS, ATPase and Fis domain